MKVESICRVEMDGDAESRFGPVPERLTDEALRETVHYWQDRLRLLHWNIHISYVPHFELGALNRQGECEYSYKQLSARIRLLDPAMADPKEWPWGPVEETIIHELLHLLFGPVWDTDDAQEAIINVLAHALYEQRMGGQGAKLTPVEEMIRDDIYGIAKEFTAPGPGVHEYEKAMEQMRHFRNGG